jgi:hypothetical protein
MANSKAPHILILQYLTAANDTFGEQSFDTHWLGYTGIQPVEIPVTLLMIETRSQGLY